MSAYTKGPWEYKRDGKFISVGDWSNPVDEEAKVSSSVMIVKGETTIAFAVESSQSYRKDDLYLDENAALISAAPDLLEALEGLVLRLDKDSDVIAHDWWWEERTIARAAIAKAKGETA